MSDPDQPVPLGDDQPVVGTYISIDLPWTSHDFSRSRFLIADEAQLRRVLALGKEHLAWIPAKSKNPPLPALAEQPEPPPEAPAPVPAGPDPAQEERDRLARAERQWSQSAALVREAFIKMRDNPKAGGALMRDVSQDVAKTVGESDQLLYLINKSSESEQHHSLNCMILATFLAKKLQLPEQALAHVAQAAVAHDVGKAMIPQWVVQSAARKKAEELLYRDHCRLGAQALRLSEAFPETVIGAIEDHHERLDGSGYPAGKGADRIGLVARIIAVVDAYDELRAPESPQVAALAPDEAMKKLWRMHTDKFDTRIVAAFIKMLGVYPPGTFVTLSDGSCALVIAPGMDSLRPRVMVYEQMVTVEETRILDLAQCPDISITGVADPATLSPAMLRAFNPRAATSFSFAPVSFLQQQ